ncbi:hypothetical protein AGR7C_Lc100057 [Agrobacterium deltaense Zutra 3/1]|uniref:Uncharacterized protein n=1 Tax=Agrobacterium deltaense Zutra 3/1 TaxID=1183427 RepID=A0A1S7QQY6_9HYPH|nr:hypothetical protein AGR7C_Lc100057 [Agrobacterium deltaense Zutra 3/1]
MTALQFFRSVGKRSSRVVHTHDVAGSNPAAATNPGAFPAVRARDAGRMELLTIPPSVRTVFPVARGLFLSPLRTRRDAFPPGSGGPFLSLSPSLPLLFVPPLMWRGCG